MTNSTISKETPIRPIPRSTLGNIDRCPRCGLNLISFYNYCPECGQRIKWSDCGEQEVCTEKKFVQRTGLRVKCTDCTYCVYVGAGISGGYKCHHPRIEVAATQYEIKKGKKINKTHEHIGYKMIKTSLRYCPYRIEKIEE